MFRLASALVTAMVVLALSLPVHAAAAISVYLGETQLTFDVAPFVENGRTLVPLRGLAESLGFAVQYDPAEQKITLNKDQTTILLWLDSTRVVVNGQETSIDVPAKAISGRTFVPVRFVAENLGARVSWDEARRAVVVTPAGPGAAQAQPQQPAEQQAGTSQQAQSQPEAQALLARTRAVSKQLPDQKSTSKMDIGITMSGSGLEMSFNVPMEMTVHSYQGEGLLTMTLGSPIDNSVMTTKMALKDGKQYEWDSETGVWTITGTYTPGDVAEFNRLGTGGFAQLFNFADDSVLAGATVAVGGTEVMDGVTTTRLDVTVSPAAFAGLGATIAEAMEFSAAEAGSIRVQRVNLSFWVDPATGFTHKSTVEMVMEVAEVEVDVPVPMSATLTLKGGVRATPVSEPIDWPDLSGASPAPQSGN